jgi:cytochrome c-type biogenesis protein CcmH/NrfF
MVNGIILTYKPSEELRDVLLFLTSSALLMAMAYVIYLATRQPSREERVGAMLATRSVQ